MDSSNAVSADVHIGFWTNWSRGPINGGTLTLVRADANILIAFVAFFIAWVGTSLWRIICFGLHYALSDSRPRDGLYQQQQAILRNASEPEAGLRLAALLWFAWRKRATRAFWRLLLIFMVALACIALATVASVFSTHVANIGDEVLLKGSRCTALGTQANFDPARRQDFIPMYALERGRQVENAANYARRCYGENSQKAECAGFLVQKFPMTVTKNASCPFESSICKTQDKNLILDSGLLDSHAHFGINSPPEDRFQYRRVLHCAPLVTEGHKQRAPDAGVPGQNVTLYTYEDTPLSEFTYMWQDVARQRIDYDMGVVSAFFTGGNFTSRGSQFRPSRELTMGKTDAEIMLFFLSTNAASFTNATQDPWYEAEEITSLGGFIDLQTGEKFFQNVTEYRQKEPASPVGCRLQDQFCNPNKPAESACSPLGTIYDPVDRAYDVFDNDTSPSGLLERLGWFTWILADSVSFHQIPRTLRSCSLLARYQLGSNGQQPPIPATQWMTDLTYWFQINMAMLQAAPVITATGPTIPEHADLFNVPPDPAVPVQGAMCGSQLIQSKDHASFSTLGLILVFTLGFVIILTSYILDPIMTCLQRKHNIAKYQRLEWSTNGFLQLQRLAYEEVGQGSWEGADGDVPVTKKGDVLSGLDLEDEKRPIIGGRRVVRVDTLRSWEEAELKEIKSKESYRSVERPKSMQ
ncbi:hypothetical protein QBC34DRAFT_413567 [Podospora aff. communis PSN243]|uniref:Uncharacterized protein n=1 Tax=Podospora aff. communis PSN243 TaxID=3040156 RepID=A0AAV9GAI0_9PEZI|nr:hypothetical protein QBC34DRAFT_413567 [Podospora aff. communis PSN243]